MASRVISHSSDPDDEKQINLTALQRIDECIVEIIDNASQAALYKYCLQSNEWLYCGVKGSFFLYKRSCTPYYGFLIMNQMSTTNQVEPFISGLDFLLREPFLLYKTTNIFGIWFYEVEQFFRIASHIQQIVKSMKGKARLQRQRSELERAVSTINHCPVPNILSLLSHAQMEYEKQNSLDKNSQSVAASHPNTIRQKFLSLDENGSNFFQNQSVPSPSAGPPMTLKSQDSVPNVHVYDRVVKENSVHQSKFSHVLASEMPAASQVYPAPNGLPTTVPEISGENYSFGNMEATAEKAVSADHNLKYKSCQTNIGHHSTLYQNQLGQALFHLLSTESNVLAKIHRAYISSLNSHIKPLSSN